MLNVDEVFIFGLRIYEESVVNVWPKGVYIFKSDCAVSLQIPNIPVAFF